MGDTNKEGTPILKLPLRTQRDSRTTVILPGVGRVNVRRTDTGPQRPTSPTPDKPRR